MVPPPAVAPSRVVTSVITTLCLCNGRGLVVGPRSHTSCRISAHYLPSEPQVFCPKAQMLTAFPWGCGEDQGLFLCLCQLELLVVSDGKRMPANIDEKNQTAVGSHTWEMKKKKCFKCKKSRVFLLPCLDILAVLLLCVPPLAHVGL